MTVKRSGARKSGKLPAPMPIIHKVKQSSGTNVKPEYNTAFVKKVLDAAKTPPEATFNNVDDLMKYLDE